MLCFDSHNYGVEATTSHPEREVKQRMSETISCSQAIVMVACLLSV